MDRANGWFEWQRTGHGKQPFFLALEDGSPLSLAALWEHWDNDGGVLESFIITVASPTTLTPGRESEKGRYLKAVTTGYHYPQGLQGLLDTLLEAA